MSRAFGPGRTLRRSTVFSALLLVLIIALCVLRFRHLGNDLPYGIVSHSTAFVTDEGWYTKSAQLLARYGLWRTELDFSFYSHTSLYALGMSFVFRLFGVGLEVARSVSVVSFWVSLVVFYVMARTALPRLPALLGCLAISATLSVVTYSRMAIVEPVGVAISLLALLLWVVGRGRSAWCVASLCLASMAVFLKLSFVFTFGVVAALWLLDAWIAVRRHRRHAVVLVLSVVLATVGTVWGLSEVRQWAGEDWAAFSRGSAVSNVQALDLSMITKSELKALRYRSRDPDKVALILAALLIVPAFLRRVPSMVELLNDRAFLAMASWGTAGFALFSSIPYQPSRYYYFFSFPLTFLALWSINHFWGTRRVPATVFFVGLHLMLQIPGYVIWLSRGEPSSYSQMARDVASVVNEDTVLLGSNAAYVSLFSERIRPLEIRSPQVSELCARVDRWRPGMVIHYVEDLPPLKDQCPTLVAHVSPVKTYWVMAGWPHHSPMVLATIHYHAAD